MRSCKQCQTQNPNSAKFCKKCGQSMSVTICPSCHRENDQDAKFCQECGSSLVELGINEVIESVQSTGDIQHVNSEEKLQKIPVESKTTKEKIIVEPDKQKEFREEEFKEESDNNGKKSWFWFLITYTIGYGIILNQILQDKFLDPSTINFISAIAFSTASILFYFWYKAITRMNWFGKLVISIGSAFLLNNLIGFICGLLLGVNSGFAQGFLGAINQSLNPNTSASEINSNSNELLYPQPTATNSSLFKNTPTPRGGANVNCSKWSDIDKGDIGSTKCVWGYPTNTFSRDGAFFIAMGDEINDFYFINYGDIWFEGMVGNCVMATGEIKQLGSAPVMVVPNNGFYKCK